MSGNSLLNPGKFGFPVHHCPAQGFAMLITNNFNYLFPCEKSKLSSVERSIPRRGYYWVYERLTCILSVSLCNCISVSSMEGSPGRKCYYTMKQECGREMRILPHTSFVYCSSNPRFTISWVKYVLHFRNVQGSNQREGKRPGLSLLGEIKPMFVLFILDIP